MLFKSRDALSKLSYTKISVGSPNSPSNNVEGSRTARLFSRRFTTQEVIEFQEMSDAHSYQENALLRRSLSLMDSFRSNTPRVLKNPRVQQVEEACNNLREMEKHGRYYDLIDKLSEMEETHPMLYYRVMEARLLDEPNGSGNEEHPWKQIETLLIGVRGQLLHTPVASRSMLKRSLCSGDMPNNQWSCIYDSQSKKDPKLSCQIYYRDSSGRDNAMEISIVTEVAAPLLPMLCLLLEMGMYEKWAPMTGFSHNITNAGVFRQGHLGITSPFSAFFSHRDVVLNMQLIDDLKNNRVVTVYGESDRNDQVLAAQRASNYSDANPNRTGLLREVPSPPEIARKTVRVDVKRLCVEATPSGTYDNQSAKIEMSIVADTFVKPPRWLINHFAGHFFVAAIDGIQEYAKEIQYFLDDEKDENFKTSSFEPAAKELIEIIKDSEFYTDMDRKIKELYHTV